MADSIFATGTTRAEKYASLLPQMQSLMEGETDPIANMANFSSVIHEVFGFLWVGFYRVVGNDLVLGPFQGPLACTRIPFGKGVCGKSLETGNPVVVPDVNLFSGHIACSPLSRSEIVIPLKGPDEKVWAVLDIDSSRLNDFSEIDVKYLTEMLSHIRNSV
jgi:L-methionine (R)-S-oxide reductase